MKRFAALTVLVALVLASSYSAYVLGWYRGHEYQAVLSGMSEAKVALSAARSLRQSDPELALELLEANISWMNAMLHDQQLRIPENERGNFQLVLDGLHSYYDEFATTSPTADGLD